MLFQTEAPEEHRGALRPDPNREPTQKEIWKFYEYLRTTGKTNMVGAPRYAEFYLDIPKKRAEEEWHLWVDYPNKVEKTKQLLRSS